MDNTKKNQAHNSTLRRDINKRDAKSCERYNIEKCIRRDRLLNKISEASEEEKFIAGYFYSKASFQCKGEDYRPVLNLFIYMFGCYGYPKEYAINYLNVNKFLFFKSREEILSRFAVLQLCGIDELTALSRPRLLFAYTDEIIYKAMKQMQKSGMTISSDSLTEYILSSNFKTDENHVTQMRLKSAAELYAKSRGL